MEKIKKNVYWKEIFVKILHIEYSFNQGTLFVCIIRPDFIQDKNNFYEREKTSFKPRLKQLFELTFINSCLIVL